MKRAALFLVLVAAAVVASAYDFSASGFTAAGTRNVGGRSYAVLSDSSGGELLFGADAEPSAERIAALTAIVAAIRSWTNFDVAEIRAVNSTDHLQVVAIPKRFERDGVNLLPAVPSGVQLFYATSTEYDFKVKSGDYILRVRGLLTNEDDLEQTVLAAVKDPVTYLTVRDPTYVVTRMRELEARIDRLETGFMASLNGGKLLRADAVAKLVELKQADTKLDKTKAAAQLKQAGLPLSGKEIEIVFLVKFGER